MKKIMLGVLAMAGMLMVSCAADDQPENKSALSVSADDTGGPGGGNGHLPTPPPPPPPPLKNNP